ncbi:MAG TPA: hypothetical protein VEV17_20310 [Bryobacteraceae bacterium]|nr:hypothetical protein [Bryobacteraceae bacterium]
MLSLCLAVFIGSPLVRADKKNDAKFSPGPASSYRTKQTNESVTVAASAYDTEELAHKAFGKLDPNQYGVLPVLVIIQNDTDQALKLDTLEVDYTSVDGRHEEATPPSEVQTLGGARRPRMATGAPIPLPPKVKKNPLNVWEIEGRSFAAKMLPPHESASGFFYFQVEHRPGAKFFLTGIKAAATGKDFFYFEVPLDYHR